MFLSHNSSPLSTPSSKYDTLYQLWSQEIGYPLQLQSQKECYLFSVSTLLDQLCQWFGLTLPSDDETTIEIRHEENHKFKGKLGVHGRESASSMPISSINRNSNSEGSLIITNSNTSLIRFLRLWALAFQQQTKGNNNKINVNLIRIVHEKDHCDGFVTFVNH